MAARFAEISFTHSVKAAQTRYGSREANLGFERSDNPRNQLTERERQFIEERDSFYQATVNENGWPYVQFRGGLPGFLKVLDERTLGYPDFRGNRQYLSVGNLDANGRVSLILMDYPNRRRLKIWAQAQVLDEADAPALVASLEMPGYRAQAERAIILTVEAFDWNCPRHITPRFKEEEILASFVQPLEAQIEVLLAENAALKARLS